MVDNPSDARKRRDNLPINRKVLEQVKTDGDALIDGSVNRFLGELHSRQLPDAVRNILRHRNGEVFEELMRQGLKQAASIPKKSRPKKWAEPIVRDDALVTFGDLKRRLEQSVEYVSDEVAHMDDMPSGTAEAVGIVYQQALLQLSITIDRLQDPVGQAARRAKLIPPTDGSKKR